MSLSLKNLLLTGRPGIGKTTLINESVRRIRETGIKIGGISTREIRSRGIRKGFMIRDIESGREAIMASTDFKKGPNIGRYRVDISALTEVGVTAIHTAIEEAEVIVIDEIGPMELLSPEMSKIILRAIESAKPVLGVIHWKMRERLTHAILSNPKTKVVEVRHDNRDSLVSKIVDDVLCVVI
jgi:nucleoside-triphosphatase